MSKELLRKISPTMTSQHPDNAMPPPFMEKAYVDPLDELAEIHHSLSELNAGECMIDWEGKIVHEAVVETLYIEHGDFFAEQPIGVEKFLTFRLPNPKTETDVRLPSALMCILRSSVLAKQFKFEKPPLFEAVLPMTETAEDIIVVQEAFRQLANIDHPLFRYKDALKHLELIPLFEDVETIMDSDKILREYLELHQERFGFLPKYLRPFIARSDPALNSGLVPSVLAAKVALSRYSEFEENTGIALYPIIGTGSLPFRGSLRPDAIENFVDEYKGIDTALVQSAFRYDWTESEAREAIENLNELLPQTSALRIPAGDERKIRDLNHIFESKYAEVIGEIAPLLSKIAGKIPPRRARLSHNGLLSYSRENGGTKLPRAIGFAGALYSLGVPPEFIGTGRALWEAKEQGVLDTVEKYYVNLTSDLKYIGGFLNRENLMHLAEKSPALGLIAQDVEYIEAYLGETFCPRTGTQEEHYEVTAGILKHLTCGNDNIGDLIEKAAICRKSIG